MIGTNITRSLRVMGTVLLFLREPWETHRKQKTEGKGTDVQRVFWTCGEGAFNKEYSCIFSVCWQCSSISSFFFCSTSRQAGKKTQMLLSLAVQPCKTMQNLVWEPSPQPHPLTAINPKPISYHVTGTEMVQPSWGNMDESFLLAVIVAVNFVCNFQQSAGRCMRMNYWFSLAFWLEQVCSLFPSNSLYIHGNKYKHQFNSSLS